MAERLRWRRSARRFANSSKTRCARPAPSPTRRQRTRSSGWRSPRPSAPAYLSERAKGVAAAAARARPLARRHASRRRRDDDGAAGGGRRLRALASDAVRPVPRRARIAAASRSRRPDRARRTEGAGGGTRVRRRMGLRRALRGANPARCVQARRPGARAGDRPAFPDASAEACHRASGGGLRRRQFTGVDLSVLARRREGSGERGASEDRRRRIAGGDPALHRALHGEIPAAQHIGRVVGRQSPGGRPEPRARGRRRSRVAHGLRVAGRRLGVSALRPRPP